ncbi:Helix-turn-helix transcriptional regulator [Hyphomicrobium sp. 1Nfss2.1]
MSSSMEVQSQIAARLHSAAVGVPDSTTVDLRGGVGLTRVRPGSRTSVPLSAVGTYFCITFAGSPTLKSDEEPSRLQSFKPDTLYILRQPCCRCARRIDFTAPATLAVIVHFPSSWCATCPRGLECQISTFLMGEEYASSSDLQIDLDEFGLTHAKALLDLSFDTDADILTAEQAVLALLAWGYASHKNPKPAAGEAQSLPPRTVSKLRLAADILTQRLDDPPTITELSTLVGMNECDLKRCFKCRYGDSIASFSRYKRLAAAQNLLLHSDLTIAEIALEAGFANPSQFARAFRRQFDLNPAQYRTARGRA